MKCFKLTSLAIVLFGWVTISSAQTLQEVAEAINNGRELMAGGDLDGAIASLEKSIELAKAIGDDAEEMQVTAESALPNLYLQRASKIPSTDYTAILAALNATVEAAEKYNNPDVKERAEKRLPQTYYAMGVADYSARKYEEAIINFDQALARDPEMAGAYFIKGACYQNLKDEPKMEEAYKMAMEKGTTTGDALKAKNQLRNYYYNAGINSRRAQKWDEAIAWFIKSLEVDDAYFEAYFGLASSYNSKKNWDDAILNLEKALQIKEDFNAYYELGVAYAGKKDNAKACENFKKVTSGSALEGAKYQIEHVLKCK